jgi:hypothetical protein
VSAGTNVPRFDYNQTTLAPLGLLIEDARTNVIRNPRCEGAVPGTPGTMPTNWSAPATAPIAPQVVGSGTENGIPYVDVRFSGTTSGVTNLSILTEGTTVSAATVGQTWSASAYVRLVGGSLGSPVQPLQINIIERSAVGVNLASGVTILSPVPTGAALSSQRYRVTYTLVQATVAFVTTGLFIQYGAGEVVDFTIRVGAPQLELGPMITSNILPPVGAPAATTRAVDACTVPITMSGSVGTIYCQFMFPYSFTTAPSVGAKIDDGTGSANGLELRTANAHTVYASDAVINSTALVNINVATYGSVSAGATLKQAIAYSTGNSRAAGGGTLGTASTTAFSAGTFNRLVIGNNSTGNRTMNGYVQAVRLYSGIRLIDSNLQNITS